MLNTEKLEGWNTMEMVKVRTFNFLPFASQMLKREYLCSKDAQKTVTRAAASL